MGSARLLVVVAVLGVAGVGSYVLYELLEEHFEQVADDFICVVPGKLYRSDQPRGRMRLMLQRHDIGTVVDLRARSEDPHMFDKTEARSDAVGATFVSIPVAAIVPTDEQFTQFLATVRSADRPVLVHCEHGKSRTGIMVAAYRIVVQGWPVDRALQEMTQYGYKTDDKNHAARLEALQRFRQDRAQWLARMGPANLDS